MKNRERIEQLESRVSALEYRAILKPECDPADVAFNRAQPWQWQVPTAAPVDGLADLRAENARLLAERDSLRARIEAGRVMYGGMYGHQNKFEMWTFEHVDTDTMTARLIDIAPISDAGDVEDERKGKADRRENALWCPPENHKEKPCHRRYAPILMDTKTIEAARSNDRRRTPGTRADRKAEA